MKNINIVQAKKNDQDIIIDFLIKNHVWKAPKSQWLNIFNNNWCNINNYGYILLDGNIVVGYFGVIFSNSKFLTFKYTANIHTWVVLPKYRTYSLSLLRKVLELENTFLISHSTINEILKIYFKFNWKILDEYFYYIFGSFYSNKNINFKNIDHNNYLTLSENNIKTYLDHRKYNVCFYKVEIKNEELLIIGKLKKLKKLLNFFEIIYVSDTDLFNLYGHQFINNLKSKTNCNFCRIDGRFVNQDNKMISKKFKMKGFKKIYFCQGNESNIKLSEVNNLYSEIFLLDL